MIGVPFSCLVVKYSFSVLVHIRVLGRKRYDRRECVVLKLLSIKGDKDTTPKQDLYTFFCTFSKYLTSNPALHTWVSLITEISQLNYLTLRTALFHSTFNL